MTSSLVRWMVRLSSKQVAVLRVSCVAGEVRRQPRGGTCIAFTHLLGLSSVHIVWIQLLHFWDDSKICIYSYNAPHHVLLLKQKNLIDLRRRIKKTQMKGLEPDWMFPAFAGGAFQLVSFLLSCLKSQSQPLSHLSLILSTLPRTSSLVWPNAGLR